jgi:hypothetical protein
LKEDEIHAQCIFILARARGLANKPELVESVQNLAREFKRRQHFGFSKCGLVPCYLYAIDFPKLIIKKICKSYRTKHKEFERKAGKYFVDSGETDSQRETRQVKNKTYA